jgi:hypothetical protein
MLDGTHFPVAIIPASRPNIRDSENVQRANDVAMLAKANGMGVFVLEGRGTVERELLVLVVGNETYVVNFARKVIREADAATKWFLLGRHGDDLLKENIDLSRETCLFQSDGFTLPDGTRFKFVTAYTADQFNTAWGHSLGAEVGEYLRAV